VLAGLGDVVRLGALVREGVPLAKGAMSVVFDRAFGVAALIMLVVVGIGLAWVKMGDGQSSLALALSVVAPLVVLSPLVFFDKLVIPPVQRFLDRRLEHSLWSPVSRLVRFGETVSNTARRLLFRTPDGAAALALSIVAQLAICVALWRLSLVLGTPIGLADALLVLPPSLLIAAIPISIGGWGVREGALTAGLMAIGVGRDAAIEVSLLFGLVLLAGSLPGALGWPWLLALGNRGVRKAQSAT
jgi:uncharacterized membrane protein YbhN (UPF0104 family)